MVEKASKKTYNPYMSGFECGHTFKYSELNNLTY